MEVMTVADAIAKRFASLFSIPKILFKTWLRIQFNIVCFPLRLVPAVGRIKSWKIGSPSQHSTEPENSVCAPVSIEQSLEPKSEVVVKQVKKLRNCVAMSIDIFTGRDFFWDLPILEEKSKRYEEALREGDPVKIAAAKKAMQEHPIIHPIPKSKEEYNRFMEEARRGTVCVPDTVPKSVINATPLHHNAVSKFINDASVTKVDVSNVLKPKKKVEFRLDNEETLNTKREVISMECRHNKRLSLQNKRLRSQLMTTNNKLEELLIFYNALLEEVSKLNVRFNKLTEMSIKISALEDEISHGKKLVREIEEERDEMKLKFLALEELIKEEENYLDDLSCESGYEETENVCDSHDEL